MCQLRYSVMHAVRKRKHSKCGNRRHNKWKFETMWMVWTTSKIKGETGTSESRRFSFVLLDAS